MLAGYPRKDWQSQVNGLREVIQGIALLGLWRAKFFEHAAFYGGTALRALHKIDRFSEDMDFSLLKPNPEFNFLPYLNYVSDELESFGLTVSIVQKAKGPENQIHSAFIKSDTVEQVLVLDPSAVIPQTGMVKILKIKVEVDVNPPCLFQTEMSQLVLPIPFPVRVYGMPYLFAGKMHALLFRDWKHRVKGRDWYDFVWFVSRQVPLDLRHLEARMRQTGNWQGSDLLTPEVVREKYIERLDRLDIDQAREDCIRFVERPDSLDGWTRDLFITLAGLILFQ